jgi:hypothetical protein
MIVQQVITWTKIDETSGVDFSVQHNLRRDALKT